MHLACPVQKQEKHFHSVYREETSNQRLDRLGANNSRNIVRILQPKFSRKRRGSANVICNKEKPFSIQYERRSSKVIVECHYTFTNEFDFTFES